MKLGILLFFAVYDLASAPPAPGSIALKAAMEKILQKNILPSVALVFDMKCDNQQLLCMLLQFHKFFFEFYLAHIIACYNNHCMQIRYLYVSHTKDRSKWLNFDNISLKEKQDFLIFYTSQNDWHIREWIKTIDQSLKISEVLQIMQLPEILSLCEHLMQESSTILYDDNICEALAEFMKFFEAYLMFDDNTTVDWNGIDEAIKKFDESNQVVFISKYLEREKSILLLARERHEHASQQESLKQELNYIQKKQNELQTRIKQFQSNPLGSFSKQEQQQLSYLQAQLATQLLSKAEEEQANKTITKLLQLQSKLTELNSDLEKNKRDNDEKNEILIKQKFIIDQLDQQINEERGLLTNNGEAPSWRSKFHDLFYADKNNCLVSTYRRESEEFRDLPENYIKDSIFVHPYSFEYPCLVKPTKYKIREFKQRPENDIDASRFNLIKFRNLSKQKILDFFTKEAEHSFRSLLKQQALEFNIHYNKNECAKRIIIKQEEANARMELAKQKALEFNIQYNKNECAKRIIIKQEQENAFRSLAKQKILDFCTKEADKIKQEEANARMDLAKQKALEFNKLTFFPLFFGVSYNKTYTGVTLSINKENIAGMFYARWDLYSNDIALVLGLMCNLKTEPSLFIALQFYFSSFQLLCGYSTNKLLIISLSYKIGL